MQQYRALARNIELEPSKVDWEVPKKNVAHHGWATKKILRSRLAKTAKSALF